MLILDILKKVEKPIALVPSKADFERERLQALNKQIIDCPHYSSKVPGQIFCKGRKRFVTVTDCKVCCVGRGA